MPSMEEDAVGLFRGTLASASCSGSLFLDALRHPGYARLRTSPEETHRIFLHPILG